MMEVRLAQLLRNADCDAPGVAVSAGELAARVRVSARRRRAVRRAGAGALVLLAAAIPVIRWSIAERTETVAAVERMSNAQVEAVQQAIQGLREEVERSERMVLLLDVNLERPVSAAAPLMSLDSATELLIERQRAAAVLEYEADRLARNAARRESALAEYHRLVELFPGTLSAERARRRIEQMKS